MERERKTGADPAPSRPPAPLGRTASAVRPVQVRSLPITLGAFLKLAQAVATGGEGKNLVQGGGVVVNGQPEQRRHRRLLHGDVVVLPNGQAWRVQGPPTQAEPGP
jgi:ribosome-associated protein